MSDAGFDADKDRPLPRLALASARDQNFASADAVGAVAAE